MFRFVLILACCQAALAQGFGAPAPKRSSKNSVHYRTQQYYDQHSGEYSGSRDAGSMEGREYESYYGERARNTTNQVRNAERPYRYGGVILADLKRTRLPLGILADIEDLVLPETFDARERWPECPSLRTVRNQGCCGSCWAVSAAAAMTDRWCIRSKGQEQFTFSSMDLVSCCHVCGRGCEGGTLGPAWKYWVNQGLSSGGPVNSRRGCLPYPFTDACTIEGQLEDTPKCTQQCQSGHNVTDVAKDRRFGRTAYSLPNDERSIMQEIYLNGPVQASFDMYFDLRYYTKGVYRHRWGPLETGHAVKLIGWGEEDGEKYWLVANSWGSNWGDHGFFKFVRGENHCSIEQDVHAGLPDFKRFG